MGKVVRILVIILAILGIVATYFAYINFSKREVLIGRTHLLEDYFVKVAGTIEAEDPVDTPQPSYPERDISDVTSREIENPERSAFWDSYNNKFEPSANPAPRMDYSDDATRQQLRQYYRTDSLGKYEIDGLTGKPYTKGAGTMDELLSKLYDRAKSQYSTLSNTRAELPKLREELIKTIEELNALKQSARGDKRTIEERDTRIAALEGEKRELEGRIERLNEEVQEAQAKVKELEDENAAQSENIQKLEDRVAQQDQVIRELRGTGAQNVVMTKVGDVEAGVLTPGDKGKILSANQEWMYAIIEFTPEFMAELIGPEHNRPLPQAEVMVKRANESDPDKAFVTRLRLRQAIRNKNIVIADILADWQQQPIKDGDVVFY